MRGRGFIGLIAIVAIGVGCSSSSKGSSTPSSTVPVRSATVSIASNGLTVSGSVGVVATGSAKQTLPADLAAVVVGEGDQSGPSGSLGFSSSIGITDVGPGNGPPTAATADNISLHTAIRAALRPLGFTGRAVAFVANDGSDSGDGSGNESVRVEVPVERLPKIATAVVAAIKKADPAEGASGLRFGVADCTVAIVTARDKAIADARTRAQALAVAAGVTLGELMSVSEATPQTSALALLTGSGQNPCGRDSLDGVNGITTPLSALGAKPEVKLTETISASYALGDGTARTVSASGVDEESGPADAADIIVLPQSLTNFNPTTGPTKIDSARVLSALAPFGLPKKDIEIEVPPTLPSSSLPESSAYVRVHVTIPQLKSIGVKIVAAVDSVVGTDGTAGVLFSSARCDALVAKARAGAVADANKHIDALARSAKVQAGPVVGIVTSGTATYFADIDPCHPDLDDLASGGILSYATSVGGLPGLSSIDADPEVTVDASLSVSRAISS